MKWKRGEYLISDDPKDADLSAIYAMLRKTYWANKRTRAQVKRSLAHSVCFSLLHRGKQIGLARAVTDYGALALICDVVIHDDYRGKGLGKWLMRCVLKHPAVAPMRKFLITKDAQGLYRQCGFETHPFECMIKYEPGPRKRKQNRVRSVKRR